MRSVPSALLASVLVGPVAFAHGGIWRPAGGDPTSPGGAGAPTTPGRGGGATPGGRKSSPDLDRWEAWWYFQREAYLPRHTVARNERPVTSNAGSGAGHAAVESAPDSPLLPEDARALVLPVLVNALKDAKPDVVDAAAIALGRSVEATAAGPFLEPIEKTVAHKDRSPQQAATLALGILEAPEGAAVLREIVQDTPAGRGTCGATGPIDDLLRGLAALALGFSDERASIGVLASIARAGDSSRDLAGSAVLALGLHKKQSAFATVELVKLLEEPTLDRDVRAQVPIALQRLDGARALLPKMLDLFRERRTPNDVARSLAIALGNVAHPDEAEIVDALLGSARFHDDATTRHFALLALGRLYERAGPLTKDAEALRTRVHADLLKEARDPQKRTTRPFAALALALIGRGERLASPGALPSPQTEASIRVFEQGFLGESDASSEGAFAISLGLVGATGSAKMLRKALDETQIAALRGHLATALALLHDVDTIPKLRALLEDRSVAPGLRIDVARALGMLGDKDFEPRLIELLGEAEDIPRAAAYAKALGMLGGRRSVEALVTMAQLREQPTQRRSFAVVALGLLAEKSEFPWNVRYLIDANFTTPLRPLQEVFDIL